MKKVLVLLSMALILTGCQSTTSMSEAGNIDEAYERNFTETIEISGVTFKGEELEGNVVSLVRFSSYQDLVNDVKIQAQNEMWDEATTKEKIVLIDTMFNRGRFHVVGYENTIGAASNGYLKAMIIQNGKAIESREMKGIAKVPSHNGSESSELWWNSTILRPNTISLDEPFEVRVVSTIGETISRYVYTPLNQ